MADLNVSSNERVIPNLMKEHSKDLQGIFTKELQEQGGQSYLSKVQVELLLAEHFKRIEKLLQEQTQRVDQKPSISEWTKDVQSKLKDMGNEFQEVLQAKVQEAKQALTNMVKERIDEVKEFAHNKVQTMVIGLNDRVKEFTERVDNRFAQEQKKLQETQVPIVKEKTGVDNTLTLPQDKEISDLMILKTRSGYYVGRQQYSEQSKEWEPYNRVSKYASNREEAQQYLSATLEFKQKLEKIDTNTLLSLNVPIAQQYKTQVIEDTLKHDRGAGKELQEMKLESKIPEEYQQLKVNRLQAEKLLEKHFQNLSDKDQYEYSRSRFDEKENTLTRGYDHKTIIGGFNRKTLTLNLATLKGIEENMTVGENMVPERSQVPFKLKAENSLEQKEPQQISR